MELKTNIKRSGLGFYYCDLCSAYKMSKPAAAKHDCQKYIQARKKKFKQIKSDMNSFHLQVKKII